MKIRTDFVTNSSSASYKIEFLLKSDGNAMAFYSMRTSDGGTYYDGDSTQQEPFKAEDHAKSLELRTPSVGRSGEIILGYNPLQDIKTIHEVISEMMSLVHADLYGGRGFARTSWLMPLAVDALEERCMSQGITRENLRIIGGKIHVMPWGDSYYETDEYIEQWGINVQEQELRSTGTRYWRGRNDPSFDTRWQDTLWWPVKGGASGVPYQLVASQMEARRGIAELNLSGLDSASITSMKSFFEGFESLEALDLSGFNTSHATNMSGMFHDCNRLKSLDLSGFDTSHVTVMNRMFDGCGNLTKLDLSGFDTSNVTRMREMFNECRGLTNLDLSGWDTSRVTDMHGMFYLCTHLTSLDLSSFGNEHVTDMSHMFYKCLRLKHLNLSGFGTPRVKDMNYMFAGCISLTEIDLSGFDTSLAVNIRSMFATCRNLQSIDLSGCDTSRVRYLYNIFDSCRSLKHWAVNETWPIRVEDAIPTPTAANGKWWSERARRWMSVDEIRERGPIADSFWYTESYHQLKKRRRH